MIIFQNFLEWCLKNIDILTLILLFISTIGTILIPIILTIWGFYSEAQREKREMKSREHNILLQHIDNLMIPLAKKLRQDHDLLQTDPNFIRSVMIEWDQLHQKSIGTFYNDSINQIYEEINELWEGYNYRTSFEDRTNDSNSFEIVWAIFQLYSILNNKKACDDLRDFLAGLNENFNIMKRYHIDKEEQETRERVAIKKEQTLLKLDTMITNVVNTINATETKIK